jgi:hypothetical protein
LTYDITLLSVGLFVRMCIPFVVARAAQTVAMNTHATIEEFLDTSLFMHSMSYQGKVGD